MGYTNGEDRGVFSGSIPRNKGHGKNDCRTGSDTVRIEKINDNQIRCTLNAKDLSARELNLGELAYGSEKAQSLFREMIQQASSELGFEAEDIPLMVEAIPLSSECIMLIITKIDNPEELDTRFSKFTPLFDDESDDEDDEGALAGISKADDMLDLLNMLSVMKEKAKKDGDSSDDGNAAKDVNLTQVFTFPELDDISRVSSILNTFYHGENALYKDRRHGCYCLVVKQSDHTPEEFNKVCNILTEYGRRLKSTYSTESYFQEHLECIIRADAVSRMSSL